MKKQLLLMLLTVMLPMGAWCYGVGDEFTVSTAGDVEMRFKILNEEAKTCGVYGFEYNKPAIDPDTEGAIIIPKIANGYTVTRICKYAFYNCKAITSITIPNSMESIETMSFNKNDALATIVVEEGNPVLDSRDNCNAVIRTRDNALIVGCKNTVIPNTVTSIEFYAFLDQALTSITIPASVSDIDDGAFYGCSSLNTISVESSNVTYDSRENCNAVIETASNMLVVGTNTTIIPETVKKIGRRAFLRRKSLQSITIPNSVTAIDEDAFYSSGLTSITIPNSVRTIGEEAFSDCEYVESITLGNKVRTIGKKAFSSCGISGGITEITIPESVTSIGEDAFRWTRYKKIVSLIEEPFDISDDTFYYNYEFYENWQTVKPTLYVPAGTKADYQACEGWNKFQNIVELEGQTGIDITSRENNPIESYSINGQRVNNNSRGLKIVRMSDGTVRKVIIR